MRTARSHGESESSNVSLLPPQYLCTLWDERIGRVTKLCLRAHHSRGVFAC
jgi:hypothetical protein